LAPKLLRRLNEIGYEFGKRDFKKIYHIRGGVAYFMTIANSPNAR